MMALHGAATAELCVGIEARAAARPAAGGIAVVLEGVLHELFRLRHDVHFIVFCTVFNRELLALDAPNVDVLTMPLDSYFAKVGSVARAQKVDVLFRGYPTLENPHFPLDRQIFLIPDLQHEYYPQFFDSYARLARRESFRTALSGAGAIMTISEFARRTIEQRVRGTRDVFVATPSVAPEFVSASSDQASAEERASVPAAPFFFFPANLWPHKNHGNLVEALRRLRARTGSAAELVLTGSPAGWRKLHARNPDVPIHHLGYVSTPHLKLLYERALALTFFSRFEGFGLPLLEAFATGTPVLCSNTTSLPEVAGNAALMCDPEDVEGISRLLGEIEADAGLRADLAARGRSRLDRLSWGSAAENLDAAIQRVDARAAVSPRIHRRQQGRVLNRATLRRELAWRLLRNPRVLAFVLRVRALAAGAKVRYVRLRVSGFWPDNYVGPRLEVVIEPRERTRELRIAGRALTETSLLIAADGLPIGSFHLSRNTFHTPVVELPRGPRQIVTFAFSDSVVDEQGRAVAFLLEETNVFSEDDLYSLG